jgi:hypothetical protein
MTIHRWLERVRRSVPYSLPKQGDPEATEASMAAFLLWLILLIICWPLALLALLLYPLIWLLLLPFRILGFAVEGAFGLVRGLFLLPGRLLRP